jgi:hypothetical protein
MRFDGIKVFSATTPQQWQQIGERVTNWMQLEAVRPMHIGVLQSSDFTHHCLTITLFYLCCPPSTQA